MNQSYEQVAHLAAAQLAQEFDISNLSSVLNDYISSIQTEQEPSVGEGLTVTDRQIAIAALICDVAALGVSIYAQVNTQPPVNNYTHNQLTTVIIQQINPDRYSCLPQAEQHRTIEVVADKIVTSHIESKK
jgi:hypothetical protein